MRFTIEFYVTDGDRAPVREWLDELKVRAPNMHALVLAGISRLRDRSYHVPPLSTHVDGSLFELRVGGRNIARVLYFFRKGQRIILLHGFVKKSQTLPLRHLATAQERLADYIRRHPDA